MPRSQILLVAVLLSTVGCFPIELDVRDGKLLIPREEGFFVYHPPAGKISRVAPAEGGKPVFARFSPDGKEILTVVKTAQGFNEFRFAISPLAGGKPREVFKGENCAYVRYSPDGSQLAILRQSDKPDPTVKDRIPELHLVQVKGGESKIIARGVGPFYRWFADSKRLVVFELKKKEEQIRFSGDVAILDVASGKLTSLATALVPQQAFLDLAPDNKKVLFTGLQAGKPGANLEKVEGWTPKLFEIDIANGAIRAVDKHAHYAIYSPDGKQVLLGTPSDTFSADTLKLEIADAGLTKFSVIAKDAYMPINLGYGGDAYPGWVNRYTVFCFQGKAVYGTDGKSMHLILITADGTNRRDAQPEIDLGASKE